MAMEHLAFWLVGPTMLIGKSSGANDASGVRDCRRAASRLFESSLRCTLRAESGSDEFLKFGAGGR